MESTDRPIRLGDILINTGLVSAPQVDEALNYAKENGVRLGEALVSLGFIEADAITWAMSNQFDLSYVELTRDMVDWDFLATLPLAELHELGFLPLNRVHVTVTGVVSDPTRPNLLQDLQHLFPGLHVEVQLGSAKDIESILDEAAAMRTLHRSQESISLRQVRSVERWISEWKGAVESGSLPWIRIVPAPAAMMDYRVITPPESHWRTTDGVSEDEMVELVASLRDVATPIDGNAAAMLALCPAKADGSTLPVRTLVLQGPGGMVVGLAAIPTQISPAAERTGAATVLSATHPSALKGAMQQVAQALVPGDGEVIFLEAFVDQFIAELCTVEIPAPELRCRMARAIAEVFRPRVLVVELALAASLPLIPWDLTVATGTHLVVLLRADWDVAPAIPQGVSVHTLGNQDPEEMKLTIASLMTEILDHGA